MSEDRNELREFCALCFADDKGGSWGAGTSGTGFCANCCARATIRIPAWAVESIREQASWVGKRYYPHSEDREAYEERKALLNLVPEFPGRSFEQREDDPGQWNVVQQLPRGQSVMTIVRAESGEQAMRKCSLRYVTSQQLSATGDSNG